MTTCVDSRGGGAQTKPSTPTDQIKIILKAHEPSKDSSAILTQYEGKEPQLLQALIRRYGDSSLQSSKEEKAPDIDWEEKFTKLYQAYEPAKVANVTMLLQKYKGSECDVWKLLVQKYGPDPGDVETYDVPRRTTP